MNMGALKKQTAITVDSRYNARVHGDCTQLSCAIYNIYIYLLYIYIVYFYIYIYVHNIPAMKAHGTQNSCNIWGHQKNEALIVHGLFIYHFIPITCAIHGIGFDPQIASRSIGAGHEGIAMQFASWILVKFFLGTLWFRSLYCFFACTLWWINIDPENHQFLMETSLPTPICQGLR